MVIPEDKETGKLSSRTYYRYFRAGGSSIAIILIILALFAGEVSWDKTLCK